MALPTDPRRRRRFLRNNLRCGTGNYYGGTVFRVTAAGVFTSLYSFCSLPSCADGANPAARLLQAADGMLYGTASQDGAYGHGTIFRITPKGALTTLYNFCAHSGCPDGGNPQAGLIQATDGNFYGTTSGAQTGSGGTIFSMTPHGVLTTLHSFRGDTGGGFPYAPLLQAGDGSFYATTAADGVLAGAGTVFQLSVGLAGAPR